MGKELEATPEDVRHAYRLFSGVNRTQPDSSSIAMLFAAIG